MQAICGRWSWASDWVTDDHACIRDVHGAGLLGL